MYLCIYMHQSFLQKRKLIHYFQLIQRGQNCIQQQLQLSTCTLEKMY